jgi:hypothetical protein
MAGKIPLEPTDLILDSYAKGLLLSLVGRSGVSKFVPDLTYVLVKLQTILETLSTNPMPAFDSPEFVDLRTRLNALAGDTAEFHGFELGRYARQRRLQRVGKWALSKMPWRKTKLG